MTDRTMFDDLEARKLELVVTRQKYARRAVVDGARRKPARDARAIDPVLHCARLGPGLEPEQST
jgi:hypothetical protein